MKNSLICILNIIKSSTSCVWNEALKLSTKYNNVYPDSLIVFTLWDIYSIDAAICVGQASLSLFERNGILRTGLYKLPLKEFNAKFDLLTSQVYFFFLILNR